MIVVKVELHSAQSKQISILGTAIISNVGGTRKKGNYDVRVGRKQDAHILQDVYDKPLRTGHVKDYPRLSYNMWRLIIRALKSAFPEEK